MSTLESLISIMLSVTLFLKGFFEFMDITTDNNMSTKPL